MIDKFPLIFVGLRNVNLDIFQLFVREIIKNEGL
jgi:hypothetical protein